MIREAEQPATSSYLYEILRPKGTSYLYKFSDLSSYSSHFIFLLHPTIPLPVSISQVLGLKAYDSQILGLKVWATAWLFLLETGST